MKRFRHNKKRNTAFLYEALTREVVKSVIGKKEKEKKIVIDILKEFFSKDTLLYKEMQLYQVLCETKNVDKHLAERIVNEVKREREKLNSEDIFREQGSLVKKINKKLTKDVFSNFVPNYKNLATIFQIFNDKSPIRKKILLEQEIIENMSAEEKKDKMQPINNLVYKSFIKKFNNSYGSSLLKEQKTALNEYILSFSDNGLSFKTYLNEEISRLKKELKKSLAIDEFKEDSEMVEKANKVLSLMEGFKKERPGPSMLKKVLKIQELIREIHLDDNKA